MGISPAEPCQQRSHEAAECYDRIAAECAEQQVEPDYVWLEPTQSAHQPNDACRMVERPTSQHGKSIKLCLIGRQLISEDCEIEEWIALQLVRNVKAVLAQPTRTRGKSCDQTDLHSSPVS